MTIRIENGNCIELMKNLDDKSVDLFICDLPYGETNCKWDCKIDLDEFWSEFKRIRKSKKTACIHFCSTKFGYTLIKSNEAMFKMDMVWKKRNKTGGLQSRKRPMRNHEMVYFFYEQAPKYNRDKYHKRIQPPPTTEKKTKIVEEKFSKEYYETNKTGMTKTDIYSKEQIKKYHKENGVGFEPPNPASVVEEKEDITYNKKKYKEGGEGRKKGEGVYRIDVPHKINKYDPPNPASVLVEEEPDIYGETNTDRQKRVNGLQFEPVNPVSVLEEKDEVYGAACKGKEGGFTGKNTYGSFEPVNPVSVLEEKEEITKLNNPCDGKISKLNSIGIDLNKHSAYANKPNFTPLLPASVIEDVWGTTKFKCGGDCGRLNEDGSYKMPYDPPNPPSVFESNKVFIGKRHHQTGLNRNFIGFELNDKIYNVAEERINKTEKLI